MIQVLSKILGRKKSGSSDNSANTSSLSNTKIKEGQSIWQKATNLRQSLRHSSKAKVSQKCVPEPPTEKSDQTTALRREWGSQRNLARERRSLAAKAPPSAESASRSLQARSLCMASDWDMEEELSPRSSRSPRKLTKDSGYETSAQGDMEGAISDRLTEQGTTDPQVPAEKGETPNEARSARRLEWNIHPRPLSFSHQEVVSERGKSRPLRHSYSQREVSRQASVESLEAITGDLKKTTKFRTESASNWSHRRPGIAKSTSQLEQLQNPRYSLSSTGSLAQPEHEEIVGSNMVTRRFKKGSVYDALASTSGLDFSPVVHLKSCNPRKEDVNIAVIKPSNKLWENAVSITKSNGSSSPDNPAVSRGKSPRKSDPSLPLLHINPSCSPQEHKTSNLQVDENGANKCISAHEKYPSWPVSTSSSSSVSYRSHSWTGQTDYPKEKVGYTRPKKANQFKISTNQLQPVLERAVEYNNSTKNTSDNDNSERSKSSEKHPMKYENAANGRGQQFDFEAFHTPCIPQCFDDKNYRINSPAERDIHSPSSSSSEAPTNDSKRFINQYDHVLRNQAQYAGSVTSSSWSKSQNSESKSAPMSLDTPFLDRLRSDSAWQVPPPPVPMIPEAAPAPQAQQQQPLLHPPGNDFELSSENGTWMGSMESSSHGRGVPKWQGSYSDLSTLSTQLSNRSSLFDSGHSTMPESGRLSPQSSCESTAPSLLLEGPTRAQVVARHGCHREIVAHSARVQQPERHGSESVLYYAAGSLVKPSIDASSSKKSNDSTNDSQSASEGGLYRSHASLNVSPQSNLPVSDKSDIINKSKNCPSRQDSRKSSNSFSSEDSNPRSRNYGGDDTSGSSSDVSNITCISNYKGKKSKSLDETPSGADRQVPKHAEEPMIQTKYQSWNEPTSSKRVDDSKIFFPDNDKRQRISDPDLKAIQKQAVMSFYQRMSLAESIKSEKRSRGLSMPDMEGPPPYETASARLKVKSKLSLYPNFKKPSELKNSNKCPPLPDKQSDKGLLNSHSKSVPNLMTLKAPNLDLPPSHPMFRYSCSGPLRNIDKNSGEKSTKAHVLPNDEIISWDMLPNVLEKKRESSEKASTSIESKDPPEDNTGYASNMHYFKTHKSPRKVQLKEVHHSNETASVKVMTPDGVTLVQVGDKSKHKRRPAPPPPPKQPPKRPPPPPPPVTPPPEVVVVMNEEETESSELDKQLGELKIDVKSSSKLSSSSPRSSCCGEQGCLSSPELPLPPPPVSQGPEIVTVGDEPLPPPPDPKDVDIQPRFLDTSSLIYPKNSYMSYRSEKKVGRQGFNGKYTRSFSTSASSVDLTTFDSSFNDAENVSSPSSWEEIHNIRQHNATVIFHSNNMNSNGRLQRSSSQNCVSTEDVSNPTQNNISNESLEDTECNQSSNSINAQSEGESAQEKSVPYLPPSQEANELKNKNCAPETDNNSNSSKVLSSSCCVQEITNPEPTNEVTPVLDNNFQVNNSLAEPQSDNTNLNLDLNQNTVKYDSATESSFRIYNGNHLINRTNSATQTGFTLKLKRKSIKTKEELECERLSKEFFDQYEDATLRKILIPTSHHKTMYDYLDGIIELEICEQSKIQNTDCPEKNENTQSETILMNNEKIESNIVNNQNAEITNNQTFEDDFKMKKEELILSMGKKVETLKILQNSVKEEIIKNELLGQEISSRLGKQAKPNELEKFNVHVEEMEKILSLLLSLSGRLAKVENILGNLPKESNLEEKKILESKRDKLKEQHEDARRLKESIDRRSSQVSAFLRRYFNDDEYTDYNHFIKMKTKLIIDIRELDEKIHLGEEQLAALSVVAHLWKSANSCD